MVGKLLCFQLWPNAFQRCLCDLAVAVTVGASLPVTDEHPNLLMLSSPNEVEVGSSGWFI